MKIMMGCNLLTHQNSVAYTNHIHLWYHIGKWAEREGHTIGFNMPRRMSIDNMRNQTAKFALQGNFDYLFFYDDDVVLPLDSFDRLLKTSVEEKADIVAGLTYVRGYPFESMAFYRNDGGAYHISHEDIENSETDRIECDAIGFSCALISTQVLKKMVPPYFITGPNFTEDVYFCFKAKDNFPDMKIILDRSVKTDHIVGDYTINHDNVAIVKKFEEELYGASKKTGDYPPEAIESAISGFRSEDNS